MRFIIIPTIPAAQFEGRAKRKGIELNWKMIKPIKILSPKNKSILNVSILEDADIMEAFPQLSVLPQLNESEIEFMPNEEII